MDEFNSYLDRLRKMYETGQINLEELGQCFDYIRQTLKNRSDEVVINKINSFLSTHTFNIPFESEKADLLSIDSSDILILKENISNEKDETQLFKKKALVALHENNEYDYYKSLLCLSLIECKKYKDDSEKRQYGFIKVNQVFNICKQKGLSNDEYKELYNCYYLNSKNVSKVSVTTVKPNKARVKKVSQKLNISTFKETKPNVSTFNETKPNFSALKETESNVSSFKDAETRDSLNLDINGVSQVNSVSKSPSPNISLQVNNNGRVMISNYNPINSAVNGILRGEKLLPDFDKMKEFINCYYSPKEKNEVDAELTRRMNSTDDLAFLRISAFLYVVQDNVSGYYKELLSYYLRECEIRSQEHVLKFAHDQCDLLLDLIKKCLSNNIGVDELKSLFEKYNFPPELNPFNNGKIPMSILSNNRNEYPKNTVIPMNDVNKGNDSLLKKILGKFKRNVSKEEHISIKERIMKICIKTFGLNEEYVRKNDK